MSRKSLGTSYRILVMGFLLLCLAGSIFAEDRLHQKWSYKAGEDILELSAGDVNNDQSIEVVAASSKNVYVLDSTGRLLKSYPIDFQVSSIKVGDIDGDGAAEIILGSGFYNTSDIKGSRFDFISSDDIKEKPAYLYKIMHSQGEIHVIKGDSSGPVKWASLNDWVRALYVDDIDENGTNELLVSSGGVNIDYVEKVHTETDPVTGNLTYDRNRTEIYSENGSVKVFRTNGSLRSDYRAKETLWSIATAALTPGELKRILAGGKRVITLNNNASELSSITPSTNQNISIMEMIPYDLNKDKEKEILASFAGPLYSGVYLLNNSGGQIWEYRIDSLNTKGLFIASLDMDREFEIVSASERMLYVINKDGRLKWSQPLEPAISTMYIIDYGNSNPDFLMASGGYVTDYQIDSGFYKSQLAQSYYDDAQANFESARYEAAVANLTAARTLYAEINDAEGILKSDALMGEINKELLKTTQENAKSLYNKGRDQFYYGKYDAAKEYYLQAREIYSRIADADGVAKCDAAIAEIEKEMFRATTTSNTVSVPEVTVTTTAQGGDNSISPAIVMGLVAVLLVVLVFGMLIAKKLMNKDKPGAR